MTFNPYTERLCVDMDLFFKTFMSELASVGLGNSGALAESAIRAIAGRQRVKWNSPDSIWGKNTIDIKGDLKR